MPIGCVLFLFYYLCSEFLEIILKEMRGLAIISRFFMLLVLLLPVAVSYTHLDVYKRQAEVDENQLSIFGFAA